MGLDVDIVKFKKSEFDANLYKGTRMVEYHEGSEIHEVLADYRKYYEVRDLLDEAVGGSNQCDFYELTREMLVDVKAKAPKVPGFDPVEMTEFLGDLDRILDETNFDTEVVALSWIS